ncbi:MAG: hypothetical protein JWO94_1059, partial [Verrucomicrobiaceae bacterium]|nr:hypothetical protein [Verrucomicrobiaceae bacterium]
GSNDHGQRSVPAGLTGISAIAAGGNHNLALNNAGQVFAWGDNGYGQAAVPLALQIGSVNAIAAGGGHSLALKSDGTVVAWGLNGYGQASVPAGLGGVIAIAAGYNHSVALKSDGTIVTWGSNVQGQSPAVPSLSRVHGISAGGTHTLALVQAASTMTLASVHAGTAGKPVVFTLRNGSSSVLTLGSFFKDGANADDFTVTPVSSTTLGAGSTATFSVAFTPTAKGVRTAALHIPSNDPSSSPYDIIFTGTASAALPGSHLVPTGLVKTGGSTLIISNGPTYSGVTTTNAGSLTLLTPSTSVSGATITAGTYTGLVNTTAETNSPPVFIIGPGGYLFLTLTPGSGTFTARLMFDGTTFPIIGQFDVNGVVTFGADHASSLTLTPTVGDEVLDLTLQAGTTSTARINQITGIVRRTLTGGGAPSTFLITADLTYSTTAPLPPDLTGSLIITLPGTIGSGTLTLNTSGIITLNGTLADGTPVIVSSPLAQTGNWALFTQLYQQGILSGTLQLTSQSGILVATPIVPASGPP